ncbi:3-isopropylmalate dehydratase small subunit [Thermanaerothrix sp. 4228-RoL]|jgi:3-isopropylmalate/(R)-2-methylmalate dehydratase small subunit|uniref:3-isopropylmalate dehydratase small subunit n=1 Tax=Thermanaerothrix solaris TaxID=3058434 RepID=A0ABU3NLP9_9CHLR|nr:3-isopropylmalate dehydratase small subunit [Thermanaerothrix sp. 4228-RoL]MDT8897138.1 3-isopropylmalate dehydratase small subunit [Thermanaerothrix sp. 4228-RoL]
MEPFTKLSSRVVVLPVDNIDTDQIIPARFLKTTDRTGLGASLFADWRYLPDGQPDPAFVLNYPENQEAQILLAGDNFGCGSSREHAAWALLGWGFRAVISTSFADIFRNNALKNGLLPVTVPPEVHQELVRLLGRDPSQTVTIDLETQTLSWAGGETHFPVDPFAKDCLLRGVDELGYLLSLEQEIAAFEARRLSG